MAQEVSQDNNNSPLSANDIEEILIDDKALEEPESEPEDILADDKTPEKPQAKDEDKIEELEDKEPEELDEDELQLAAPVPRRAILAKYPNLFKDFPYLDVANQRDKQYTEVFATPREAKEAKENLETFNNLQDSLMNKGSLTEVLKGVKEADEDTFKQVVDNYLGSLNQVDPTAYMHIARNFTRMLIGSVMAEGNRRNSDDLKAVAVLLNQFVFNDSEMKMPTNYFQGRKNGQQSEVQNERQQFQAERFNAVHEELNTRADNALKSTIDRYIDPKGLMSSYVRNKAITDVLDEVNTTLSNDARFKSLIDQHWKNAFSNNFSNDSKEAILSAYKSKARSILKDVILKVRNEALKGSSARSESKQVKFKPGQTTAPSKTSSQSQSFAEKVKNNPKARTLDLLNED